MPTEKICRVAVLPFGNDSDYKGGERLFYRVFIAELVNAGNFLVSQEGDVRDLYRQMRVFPNQELNVEQIKVLANRLDVQLVIAGNLVEMAGEDRQGRLLLPKIAVNLRVFDGDGEYLWFTYHRRTGGDSRKIMHFGLVNTITELARLIVKDVVKVWLREGMTKCID